MINTRVSQHKNAGILTHKLSRVTAYYSPDILVSSNAVMIAYHSVKYGAVTKVEYRDGSTIGY